MSILCSSSFFRSQPPKRLVMWEKERKEEWEGRGYSGGGEEGRACNQFVNLLNSQFVHLGKEVLRRLFAMLTEDMREPSCINTLSLLLRGRVHGKCCMLIKSVES